MKDNLEKIDALLTLAFQESDGPFSVLIKIDGIESILIGLLYKEDIFNVAKADAVTSIALSNRLDDRRWRNRLGKDRRK